MGEKFSFALRQELRVFCNSALGRTCGTVGQKVTRTWRNCIMWRFRVKQGEKDCTCNKERR